jgi:hypothetical protein
MTSEASASDRVPENPVFVVEVHVTDTAELDRARRGISLGRYSPEA